MRARRGTCRGCAAPVVFAEAYDSDSKVILEAHESPAGPNRYAIWDDGFAHKVTARAQVMAHPKHACDGVGALAA